jgi:hypothetical protein
LRGVAQPIRGFRQQMQRIGVIRLPADVSFQGCFRLIEPSLAQGRSRRRKGRITNPGPQAVSIGRARGSMITSKQ